MRILFDSQKAMFKSPFGTLSQGEVCQLHIHIPTTVKAVKAECIVTLHDGSVSRTVPMEKESVQGHYEIFGGNFSLAVTGLYFYYFRFFP